MTKRGENPSPLHITLSLPFSPLPLTVIRSLSRKKRGLRCPSPVCLVSSSLHIAYLCPSILSLSLPILLLIGTDLQSPCAHTLYLLFRLFPSVSFISPSWKVMVKRGLWLFLSSIVLVSGEVSRCIFPPSLQSVCGVCVCVA